MKKKIALASLSTLVFATLSFGEIYEYPYLYKDPRVLGMGGANIAVGGSSTAVFYNPAGLSNLNPAAGFEVDLLGLNISTNQNSIDFISDLKDAFDTGDLDHDGDDGDDQLKAVNEVLKKYRGKNLHFDMSDYSAIGRKFSKLSFSIGFLVGISMNGKTHQGFSSDGTLELDYNSTAGLIVGLSYDFLDGDLSVGVDGKYFYRNALYHNFSSRELVDHQDDLDNYITDELAKDGTAASFDFGVIYRLEHLSLPLVSTLKPSVGFSLQNIGDLDFKDAGKIPMTANVGLAINPKLPFINNFLLAVDYIDITEQFNDSSKMKRIRFGGEAEVYDGKFANLTVRAGLYEGYATAGLDLRLGLFRIALSTYGEEVGAASGQDEDRRYVLSAFLTW